MTDVLIIGGGPAGLTAAIYAARSGMTVKVLEEMTCGGQLAQTPVVENYPSIQKIDGFSLAEQMKNQAEECGVEIEYTKVTDIEKQDSGFIVKSNNKDYNCRTVIIANGVKRRKLNCEGEEKFSGRGVSWCAVCDGNFFKNKITAVIGGGNSALEDALYLANICESVYLIHRRDEFRGNKSLVNSVMQNEKIKIKTPYNVKEIYGEFTVEGIKIEDNSGSIIDLPVNGVFEAVGLVPDNKTFGNIVKLDKNGYIIADENCLTSADGIFAAGDTRTKDLRQIITAAADGAVAAKQAFEYISKN